MTNLQVQVSVLAVETSAAEGTEHNVQSDEDPPPLGSFHLPTGSTAGRVGAEYPDEMPAGSSRMQEAEIVFEDGRPKLANQKLVTDSRELPLRCTIETQNFRPPDEKELTSNRQATTKSPSAPAHAAQDPPARN